MDLPALMYLGEDPGIQRDPIGVWELGEDHSLLLDWLVEKIT